MTNLNILSFREFATKNPSALAQEVLAEVPTQVLKYFESKGIRPNPPLPRTANISSVGSPGGK